MTELDVTELNANLEEYKEQLKQLEELLLDEPGNPDYQGLYQDVQEAIELTARALEAEQNREEPASQQPSDAAGGAAADDGAAAAGGARKRKSRFEPAVPGAVQHPDALSASTLPQQVVDQIRAAKARSALDGSAPAGWAVGAACLARCSTGQWADARVVAVTPEGNFLVQWDGVEDAPETVHRSDCKPRDSAGYKGVKGPVRKAVAEVSADAYQRYLRGDKTAVPKWMQPTDGDSEKVREKKLRALKTFKKKLRFEQKDMESAKKANDWKAFMTGKGSKKKAGFMTSTKKESMFAVPEGLGGKVGVIGSGKGMTNAPVKRSRLDF